MFAQHSAIQHLALDIGTMRVGNMQFDQSVGKKNAGSGLHLASEILKSCRNEFGITRNVARRDGDTRPGLEQDRLVALQAAVSDFRTLQILQDADGSSFFYRGTAQANDVRGMFGMRTVGKVQA